MRYIEKRDIEPACLSDYKLECKAMGVPEPLLYKNFNGTGKLRPILANEQHNVCCYCQRPVKGFRIEHSYPENGTEDKDKSLSLQLDYYNLFASCIDSQGYAPDAQYCDVAKGNQVIREFIKEKDCQKHFRYLSNGEIIPNGSYSTLKEYKESKTLTEDEVDALHAIDVLNLNCHTLVEDRKNCLNALLHLLQTRNKEDWKQTLESWLRSDTYPPYIELRIQYIERFINS